MALYCINKQLFEKKGISSYASAKATKDKEKMTDIKILELKLINLVHQGKIPEKEFNQGMSYLNENSEKSAQIERWQKEAGLRKRVLFAMGFDPHLYTTTTFTKIIYGKERIKDDIEQQVLFEFDTIDIIRGYVPEVSAFEPFRNKRIRKKVGIEYVVQHPDECPDLYKYFMMRNNIKAMEKLIEQAESKQEKEE